MSVIVGIAWTSLVITDNRFLLGIVLCGSALIPFAISKISRSRALSWKKVLALRLIDFALLGSYSFSGAEVTPLAFFALAMVHGVSNFYTLSAFEAQNTKNVLAKLIDSGKASRYLQTFLQVGYFLGAFIAGQLISNYSFLEMINFIALLGILSSAASFLWKRHISFDMLVDSDKNNAEKLIHDGEYRKATYILCFVLGFVGFHIGSFNSLIPITFQKLNLWDASSYGYASALAGLGAFIAGMFALPRYVPIGCAAALVIADFVLVFSSDLNISISSGLILGFSISAIRIELRRQLTIIATSDDRANFVASTSSFFFMLMQGASPLIMTALTTDSLLGIDSARWLFVAVGACMMGVYLATNHYRSKLENV